MDEARVFFYSPPRGRVVLVLVCLVLGGFAVWRTIGHEPAPSLPAVAPGPSPSPPDETDAVRNFLGLELAVPGTDTHGVLVADVDPDSPAARAGIRPGDVLIGIGRISISDGALLERRLLALSPDAPKTVTVARDHRKLRLTLLPPPVPPASP